MLNNLKKISRHKFVMDVFTLQFGSSITLGLNLVTSVFLARYLGPAQYGVYALIYSLLGGVRLLTQFGFNRLTINQVALASGRDSNDLARYFAFFTKYGITIHLMAALAGYWFLPQVASVMFHKPEIGIMTRPLMLVIFLGIFYTLGAATIEGFRRMRTLSLLENGAALLRTIIIVTVLISGGTINEVIQASVLAYFLATLLALFLLMKLPPECREPLPAIKEVFSSFSSTSRTDYFSQGFFVGFDTNLTRIINYLPVFLLGRFAPIEVVGYYQVANRIISVPMIAFQAIGRSLLPKLSQLYGNKNLQALKKGFWKVTLISTFTSMVTTIIFLALIPTLLLIYGKNYNQAKYLIYWLAVYVSLSGLNIGITPLLVTINELKKGVAWRTLVTLAAFPLGVYLVTVKGGQGAAIYYSVNQVLISLVSLLYAKAVLKDQSV